tara:strand:+ start:160 stop:312 length:153 start_codon:yes stop_codon:yes gene_type:complete
MIVLIIIAVFILYRFVINIVRSMHEIKKLTYNISDFDIDLKKEKDDKTNN